MAESTAAATKEVEKEEVVQETGNFGEAVSKDPYLLEDAEYIKKEARWRNKQRTLIFASRGIDGRHRHLMSDLKQIMPHHKAEAKWTKKANFTDIPELAELASCNNVCFIETRKKGQVAYMYTGRVPGGPTIKYRILNVHTCGEIKLAGNCLLGSRPFLAFDESFDETPERRVMKELFCQAFGTPRNHPKSKPFFDHIISFQWLDGKVWFRHYQISPTTAEDMNNPENQDLTEIGPRMVLQPVMMLDGAFQGKKIYQNGEYMPPIAKRRTANEEDAKVYLKKLRNKRARDDHLDNTKLGPDEMEGIFD